MKEDSEFERADSSDDFVERNMTPDKSEPPNTDSKQIDALQEQIKMLSTMLIESKKQQDETNRLMCEQMAVGMKSHRDLEASFKIEKEKKEGNEKENKESEKEEKEKN